MSKIMATKQVNIPHSDNLTAFIPRRLDDYGFTPEEFRVFCRIMRRSVGENSQGCYESVPNMALTLGISERLIRRSLQVLKACGAILIIERKAASHQIMFQTYDKWLPPNQLIAIRERLFGDKVNKDRERKIPGSR